MAGLQLLLFFSAGLVGAAVAGMRNNEVINMGVLPTERKSMFFGSGVWFQAGFVRGHM